MKRMAIGLIGMLALIAAPAPGDAQTGGAGRCDGLGTQISKRIGDQQWLVSYDFLSNTANGIVLDDAGGTTFLACNRNAVSADMSQLTFSCASPSEDGAGEWVTFSDNVAVPTGFFDLPAGEFPAEVDIIGEEWPLVSDWEIELGFFYSANLSWLEQTSEGSITGQDLENGSTLRISATSTGDVDYVVEAIGDEECYIYRLRRVETLGLITGTMQRAPISDDFESCGTPEGESYRIAGLSRIPNP